MTHRLDSSTMPEFFAARYQSGSMKVYSALIIFIFLVPYAATVYKGLGYLFGKMFPFLDGLIPGIGPEIYCMFIIAVLTAIYLVLGGYVATIMTDFIQGIIMLVGVVVMVVVIVNNPAVGGFTNGMAQLREISAPLADTDLTHLFGGPQWKFLLMNILLTSFGTWGLPQMIHKYYAVKDDASIRRATILSTIFALLIGASAYIVGMFGRLYLNNHCLLYTSGWGKNHIVSCLRHVSRCFNCFLIGTAKDRWGTPAGSPNSLQDFWACLTDQD